ncbi:hypothetical protein MMC10_002277 [Thelotrema lepadinum]|nr:hypothetical protein [Thelotrema lepadinum]
MSAAGGQARFDRIQSLEANFDMSGVLWSFKGHSAHSKGVEAYISFKSPQVVYHNMNAHLDEPNIKWIWTPERVSVQRADGTVLQSRDSPRAKLLQNASPEAPWDDLDLLYFRGYALFNYFAAPFYFTWEGFETREVKRHQEGGQTWRVLEVTYPNGFPAHCKVQRYYYDEQFKLRGLDYSSDILQAGVAAHYCYDGAKVDGLVFPMLRRVVPSQDGESILSAPSMVLLNYHSIVARDETES